MSDVCFCLKIQNFVRFRKKNNPYGFGGWYRKVCVKTTKTPGIWIPLVIKDFEMANGQSSLACLRKPPTSIFADSSGGECFGADRSLAKCEIHTLEKRAEGNIRCCPMPTYPSAFTLPPPPGSPPSPSPATFLQCWGFPKTPHQSWFLLQLRRWWASSSYII